MLAGFGLLLSFALAEAATRVVQWHHARQEFLAADMAKYREIYSDEPDTSYVFGHHPNARVTIRRGGSEFTFISNSQGLRETLDYGVLPASVVFLGDSAVEGSTVENAEVMDSVFERMTGITALNFGMASSATAQSYYWFKAKYDRRYHAKVVLLGFTYNDFPENTRLLRFRPEVGHWNLFRSFAGVTAAPRRAGPAAFLSWLIHRSAFGTLLYEQTLAPPPTVHQPELVTGLERQYTTQYLRLHDEFAREIGARLVVMLLPTRSQVESSTPGRLRFQDVVIPILDEQKIPYVDLHVTLHTWHTAHPDVRLYWDEGHPYKEGHRLIGEELARVVPEMLPGVLR